MSGTPPELKLAWDGDLATFNRAGSLGMPICFWMNLQTNHDLAMAALANGKRRHSWSRARWVQSRCLRTGFRSTLD